jgi:phosphoribosyl 1,2-cyclic phosphodiesterase
MRKAASDLRQLSLWSGEKHEPEPRPRRLFACALGTGSTGNAYVVGNGETHLLVDCGFGSRELERRLRLVGLAGDRIDAILLSHGHDDHVRGAIAASRGKAPIHSSERTFHSAVVKRPLRKNELPIPAHRHLVHGKTFAIGSIEVTTFPVPHDWPGNTGFVFSDGAGGRIGLATDVGWAEPSVVSALAGCPLVFFEFNHDVDLLRIGPYPASLKARVAGPGGHLSNDEAAAVVPRLVGPDSRRIVAVHLSRTNNRTELVEEALFEASNRLGGRLATNVSTFDRPTPLLDVTGGERSPEPPRPAPPRDEGTARRRGGKRT